MQASQIYQKISIYFILRKSFLFQIKIINGVISGALEVTRPLINAGLSKLSSFVSKSFGFTDDAAELAATTMTKDEIVQAGMNNITAEKHIAKAINNLSSTPEKALNSVDNTVDILGELGKKALPDPMNGMSKIVDNAVPDMTLGSNKQCKQTG